MDFNRAARVILLVLLLGLLAPGSAQAAVVMSDFRAIPGDGQILVKWETASEIDVSGFYLQRSATRNGAYTRISDFYIAMGDGISGALYQHLDSGLTNGSTYYYRLEIVNVDQVIEYYGPVSAVAGLHTSTPTATPTSTEDVLETATPTPSATTALAQNDTPTPTQPPANTPTLSGYPAFTPTAQTTLGTNPTLTPTQGTSLASPTPDGLSGYPAFSQTPTPGIGDTPVFPDQTLAIMPTSGTPVQSRSTLQEPAEGTPLNEQPPAAGIFASDFFLWIGAGLGGLAIGAIGALVIWAFVRRSKAG